MASDIKGKRVAFIAEWMLQLHWTTGLDPSHVHTDKDVSEIKAASTTWPGAKHSLCMWHIDQALKKRFDTVGLPDASLYKPDPDDLRKARGGADADSFGPPLSGTRFVSAFHDKKAIGSAIRSMVKHHFKLHPLFLTSVNSTPPWPGPPLETSSACATADNVDFTDLWQLMSFLDAMDLDALNDYGQHGSGDEYVATASTSNDVDSDVIDDEEPRSFYHALVDGSTDDVAMDMFDVLNDQYGQIVDTVITDHDAARVITRVDFCVDLDEKAEAIYITSLSEMYNFCKAFDLWHVWVYMYVHWYSRAQWKLWARAGNPSTVPEFRTTMMAEAHFKILKYMFLKGVHSSRLDKLTYILLNNVESWYFSRLSDALAETVDVDKPEWEKTFNHDWREAVKAIKLGNISDQWVTEPTQWVCSCPAYLYSSSLCCKHLVRCYLRATPAHPSLLKFLPQSHPGLNDFMDDVSLYQVALQPNVDTVSVPAKLFLEICIFAATVGLCA